MYITLCLIAKDENSYLAEWLDYHILLGVEHFWIYDNDSTVPLEESIQPYIQKGWVTINKIHGKGMQLFAYDHCLQTYGNLSRWIGFIDTDEFIVLKSSPNLLEFLKDYEKFGGMALNSMFFGDNKQQNRPLCGQVAGYLMRTSPEFIRNRLIKSIVQPARTLFPICPHTFMYSEGNFCVNEREHRVDDQFFPVQISKIQLNHYYTRSKQELTEKIMRGRGDGGKAYSDKNWEDVNTNSSVFDPAALNQVIRFLQLPPAIARNITALTDPSSTKILGELSKAAQQFQPPECHAKADSVIEIRKDMEELLNDHLACMDHIAQGRMQAARDIFLKLIQKYPFDLIHYTNFAAACINLNDLQIAWEAISKAWQMSPRNWLVLKCMVEYFYAVGNFEQMEKCSLLMNDFGDLEPLHLAGLSIAQWKLGKRDQAAANVQYLWPLITPEMVDNHIWYKELVQIIGLIETENNGQKSSLP